MSNRDKPRNKPSTEIKLDDDLDALFRTPLAEFTGARNTLAARLKKSGRGDDAALVKALAKPSVSAWAVNQIYWNHREAFDQLTSSGERFHKAQTSGKVADMRGALDARRAELTQLSDLATSLLRDAGHNPSLDTIRGINATLEALSVYAARSDGPRPGRLTQDVDPPGFESFGSFLPAAMTKKPPRLKLAPKPSSVPATPQRKTADRNALQLAAKRKAETAAAKASLQDAKKSLNKARARAERLDAVQKTVDAEVKKAEKRKRDAEKSLELAKAAFEYAAKRARNVADEVEAAATAVEEAEREMAKASKELESY